MHSPNIVPRRFHGETVMPRITAIALIIFVLGWGFFNNSARAVTPDLELSVVVSDTTVLAGDTSAWLSVFVTNYQDSLAGFMMQLILDRPDIMEFRTDEIDTIVDTVEWTCYQWDDGVCIDSVPVDPPDVDTFHVNGGIDTAGTAIAYWEYVNALSIAPNRHDIRVVGLSEEDADPPYTPGLPPSDQPRLLFRLNVRIYETLPSDDSLVTVHISRAMGETNFSDPGGFTIGWITHYNICDTLYCETWDYEGDSCLTDLLETMPPVYDTVVIDTFFRYWICREWGEDSQGNDSCLDWDSYDYTHPDSAAVADYIDIDSIPWSEWNEETVVFEDGSLEVVEIICGDVTGDRTVNVSDAVYIISYVFKGGPAPGLLCLCDANGDESCNIADAVHIVSYIFKGGPAPVGDCCP